MSTEASALLSCGRSWLMMGRGWGKDGNGNVPGPGMVKGGKQRVPVMITDVHAHAFPDALAPRAIAALEAECPWKAVGDGTVRALEASMDRAGIGRVLICSIATRPEQSAPILEWSRAIRSERIIPLPSVHPRAEGAARWVERFAAEGFAGIKLHPMYQDFVVDDPAMDPLYAVAADLGLFVTVHCGRDIAFPPEDDRATPARFARISDRHAQLRLLCTHLGGWHMWDEVLRDLAGREVYLETSVSLPYLAQQDAMRLIRAHGTGKVLFGTDWPWQAQDEALSELRALPLTEEEKTSILERNAERLLSC